MNKQHSASSFKPEILIYYYEIAVELYRHEDHLNWLKINHLLYMNAALAAILSFFLERNPETIIGLGRYEAVFYIGVIGLLVSFAFFITIWLGTFYLQARKAAVIELEDKIHDLCGPYFVPVVRSSKVDVDATSKQWLSKSLTVYMLRALPVGFFIFWMLVLTSVRSEQIEGQKWAMDAGMYSAKTVIPSEAKPPTYQNNSSEEPFKNRLKSRHSLY